MGARVTGPRTLIINADDFGLTEGVCRGILEALTRGVVTSTSVMMCTPDSQKLLLAHRHELSGRAGVHLQLTGGLPRSDPAQIPSLLDRRGSFPDRRQDLPPLQPEEIACEWSAQIAAFLDAGLSPTHIDSHQHVHKEPAAFAAYCRIARQYGVPARSCSAPMTAALRAAGVDCPDEFASGWTGRSCTLEALLACVERSFSACGGAGTVELMCHPGYVDPSLRQSSTLSESREQELAALCDPRLPDLLAAYGILLGSRSAGSAATVTGAGQ